MGRPSESVFQTASPFSGCPSQVSLKPFPRPKPIRRHSRLRGNDGVCCFSDGLFLFLNSIKFNQTKQSDFHPR